MTKLQGLRAIRVATAAGVTVLLALTFVYLAVSRPGVALVYAVAALIHTWLLRNINRLIEQ